MLTVSCRGTLPSGVTKRSVSGLVAAAFETAGGEGDAGVGVAVVGEKEIRRLNAEYRGKDAVTDVLSFGYDEDMGEVDVGPGGRLVRELGDIVVCLPQVRRQARANGRPIKDEFALMVVHGTLHLLGFDHETAAQERQMFGLQHEALLRAGIL